MPNVKLILGDKKNKKEDSFLVGKTKTVKGSNKKTTAKTEENIEKKIPFYYISGICIATAMSVFVILGVLMGTQKNAGLEVPKTGVIEDTEEEADTSKKDSAEAEKDNVAKKEDENKNEIENKSEDNARAEAEGNANANANVSNHVESNASYKNNNGQKTKKSVNLPKVDYKKASDVKQVTVNVPVNNSQKTVSKDVKTTDSNKTFKKTAKEECEESAGPREYLGYEVLTTEDKGATSSKTTYYRYVPKNGSRFKMSYKNKSCVVDLSSKKKAGEISEEAYIETLDKLVW